jgi:hypothetical protein
MQKQTSPRRAPRRLLLIPTRAKKNRPKYERRDAVDCEAMHAAVHTSADVADVVSASMPSGCSVADAEAAHVSYFDVLSCEDRFSVIRVTSLMRNICLQDAQRALQSQHMPPPPFENGSRNLLVSLLFDPHSCGVQAPSAKRRKISEFEVPPKETELGFSCTTVLDACESPQSDHLQQCRPFVLATVTHAIQKRAAGGFITGTVLRLVHAAPAAGSSATKSRRSLASFVLMRLFGFRLRDLVLRDIRTKFGRMLRMQPICAPMSLLQAAAKSRVERDDITLRIYSCHDDEIESTELCVISDPFCAGLPVLARRIYHLETVRLLLQYRADVNEYDGDGCTALMTASHAGCGSTVGVLLEFKADVNAQDRETTVYSFGREHSGTHKSALMFAAHRGHKEAVRLLLEHRADIDIQDKDGGTALIWASASGHFSVVELLLHNEARNERSQSHRAQFERFVNAADYNGKTSLSEAARGCHEAYRSLAS